jgi:putative flavoprotein involved in K+ transport
MSDNTSERYEVAVIGAGQAGLAIGHLLTLQGRRFVILEAEASVAPAWRTRWESLVLFTPRRYDSLPGQAFPGDPDGYPTRDEVVAYLDGYAEAQALPVQLGSAVRSLTKKGEAFELVFDDRTVEANQVVVATGPFQRPRLPQFANDLDPDVFQIHSANYCAPADIPQGTVLVVGGGNTGYQIARELASTHNVHLAVGGRQTPLPQKLLGRDLFWWLVKTKLLMTTVESRLGKKLSTRDTLIGSSPRALKKAGVEMRPRATGASERIVTFADGSDLSVDAVIWATGFELDHSWIEPAVKNENGAIQHRRGVTTVEGLYFLGLPWQHTRGSALLGWVKDDAEYIAEKIASVGRQTAEQNPEPGGTPDAAEAPA